PLQQGVRRPLWHDHLTNLAVDPQHRHPAGRRVQRRTGTRARHGRRSPARDRALRGNARHQEAARSQASREGGHLTGSAWPRLTDARQSPRESRGLWHTGSALELLDLVPEQRGGNRGLARLAAQERLGELLGLLVLHLAGQRRLVRVDVHVDQRRIVPGGVLRRVRRPAAVLPRLGDGSGRGRPAVSRPVCPRGAHRDGPAARAAPALRLRLTRALASVAGCAVAGTALAWAYLRAREPGPVRLLRAVHTGSVNDYAAYAVAGLLAVIAVLTLT